MTLPDIRSKKIWGIWPPLLLESCSDGSIDYDAITRGTRHFAKAGVHGLYTADTASEFFTMEFDEWNQLATHFRAVARDQGVLAGVGCTWTNQTGALRRVARARELGFHNIHLSQPYWQKLNEPAQRTFWRAVGEIAGDQLAVIVYSGSQNQFPLDGALLQRLREYCPAIAGTKSGGFDAPLMNGLLVQCPDLCHFAHEQVLTYWVAMGAAGCFSSLVAMCPGLTLRWFNFMLAQDWSAALEIQRRVNRFYEEGVMPVRRAGYILDKATYTLGRVPGATRSQRPPSMPIPDELYVKLEVAARRHLPEFSEELAKRAE